MARPGSSGARPGPQGKGGSPQALQRPGVSGGASAHKTETGRGDLGRRRDFLPFRRGWYVMLAPPGLRVLLGSEAGSVLAGIFPSFSDSETPFHSWLGMFCPPESRVMQWDPVHPVSPFGSKSGVTLLVPCSDCSLPISRTGSQVRAGLVRWHSKHVLPSCGA